MNSQLRAILVLLAIGACSGDDSVTGPAPIATETLDPVFDVTGPADGGTCPTVFYEHTETLANGISVGWRHVVAHFDYAQGETIEIPVDWWIAEGEGTALFDDFTERNGPNTWTPPAGPRGGVTGTMTTGAAQADWVPIQVTMESMKPVGGSSDDPEEWSGRFGVGHFWLHLRVESDAGEPELVKLGVNVHLEDPDTEDASRCPGADPGMPGTPLPPIEGIGS